MIAQRTAYDCGPVAIINFVRWSGGNWGHKEIPFLRSMMFTTKQGSELADILTVLEMLRPKRDVSFTRNHRLALYAMDSGKGIFLTFNLKANFPHIVFAYKKDGKYIFANMALNESTMELSQKQIRNLFKNSVDVPTVVVV